MSTYPVMAQTNERITKEESTVSGVSWPAVFAGASIGASLSLVMIALGSGLGLSAISPWSNSGASASTIGTSAIVWLIFTQAASAGLGGYLAGRLRVRWASVHVDEVYFRDTAHGLLVWAVGVIVTASLLTSVALSFTGSSNPVVANLGNGQTSQTTGYFVDKLFRSDHASSDSNMAAMRLEAERILARDLRSSQANAEDQNYLAQMISTSTGMNGADAKRRATDVIEQFRTEADAARKAAAHSLLWVFVSLLIGAFCASFAATVGGKQRDSVTL